MTSSDDAEIIPTASMGIAPEGPAPDPDAEPVPPDTLLEEPASPRRRVTRRRRVLLGVLFVLSCFAILTSTMAVWVHQVALNTDRWVSVVGPVAENPQVQAVLSDRIATEVVTALQVQQRLEAVLPPKAAFAAAPIAQALHDQIEQRLAVRMATPEFQQAWISANRVAHQQIVRILRGDTPNLVVSDGYIHLDLWPLIGQALTQLQVAGFIPADATLPDVSNGLSPGAEAVIEKVLGVTLPADFGTVRLMPADKLLQAQQAVRYFDLIVIILLLVTLALVLLTIGFAPRRRWMIVYLAIGGAVAIILARFALQAVAGSIADSFGDADTGTTVRSVVDEALGNLYAFSRLIILASIVIAILAYFSGRPAWAVGLVNRVRSVGSGSSGGAGGASAPASRSATTSATTSAVAAGSAGRAGRAGEAAAGSAAPAADDRSRRDSLRDWARANRRGLRVAGLAIIAFVVVWAAVGLDLALLAVLLIGLLEAALHALGGSGDDPAADDTGATAAGSTGVPGSTSRPA